MLGLLKDAIGEEDVDFLLGGYGGFDTFAYDCCKLYKKEHPRARLIFVTPYITEDYQRNHLKDAERKFDEIIYPDIENVPKKFAILYRNRYMMECADLVVAYITREFGGAFTSFRYAKKLGKNIVNLGEKEE